MYHKDLDTRLVVRISLKQYDQLALLAKKRNITVSRLIRYILSEYIRQFV